MSIHKKYCILFFALCENILLMWVVGLILFGNKINDYSQDEDIKADAVIVLTGGENRISKGLELLNNHYAEKMFISGVSHNIKKTDLLKEAHLSVQSPENIELGYKATNTVENALEIKDWIIRNNINSFYMVTSNYHLPRSIEELEGLNLDVNIIPYPVYSHRIVPQWWKSWASFKFIAEEYNKYLYVCVRNFIHEFFVLLREF